jgi:hypothetical protein
MTKGALYWRKKDEKTGKWTYKKVKYVQTGHGSNVIALIQEEE